MDNKKLALILSAKASKNGTHLRGIARELGIDDKISGDWMRGVSAPTEEELSRICEKIGCTPRDIYKELGEKPPKPGLPIEEDVAPEPKDARKTTIVEKEEKTVVEKETFTAMPEPKAPDAESKTAENKPKKERKTAVKNVTESKKKSKTAIEFPPELSAGIRKACGLKKSDAIETEQLLKFFEAECNSIHESLRQLNSLNTVLANAAFKEENAPDPRLTNLISVAKNASDEGLELAITILKKFKKG